MSKKKLLKNNLDKEAKTEKKKKKNRLGKASRDWHHFKGALCSFGEETQTHNSYINLQ